MSVAILVKLTVREAQRRKLLWAAVGLGVVFVTLYGIGFHFVYQEVSQFSAQAGPGTVQLGIFGNFFLTAGLYVINFLAVMMAVLTSVGTLSGEISSHTIQSLATKPVHRWEIVLGKWIGYAGMLAIYLVGLSGGVMLVVYLVADYSPQNWLGTMGFLVLESWVILTVSMVGGTFMSTIANGVVAFMLYGIAFAGGWVEQIGSLMQSETAVNIGILTSLILPSEAVWRRAAYLMQPGAIRNLPTNPFTTASVPSPAMMVYAGVYIVVLLGLALWIFSRRDL
jgi:ABC-type transport system involved in multi-copper enzyme maturation permease subunit